MAKEADTKALPQQPSGQASGSGSAADGTPPKAELAALASTIGEVQQRAAQNMQTFIQWQVDRASTTDEDQFALMASIISEIMEAKDAAEVLEERSALHARDIVNVPLLMHGFELREGTYEDSQTGYYAAITVSRQGSDTTRIVTCGGMKVLAKLMMLDRFGEWPQIFYFTSKKTSNGYDVLDIVKPQI